MSLEAARSDTAVRRLLVWECQETNWRSELLALDSVMIGSEGWPDMERWAREAHVSEIWGPPRSGLSVCADLDTYDPFCWFDASDERWPACRRYLQAFAELLQRWPGYPPELHGSQTWLQDCS